MDTISNYDIEQQKKWDEIEELIIEYQKQFEDNSSAKQDIKSQKAALELINRFDPLFKKYLNLLKGKFINYYDSEMKNFVYLFIEDKELRKALTRKYQSKTAKHQIDKKFNFVRTTYGELPEEDIITDLHSIFLTLARRYKQAGRSFCVYVYSSFKYEVARFIKRFTKDPINLTYKNVEYLDTILSSHNKNSVETSYEDKYNENDMGLPNLQWMHGLDCSEEFELLSNLERMVLVKYYLEGWHDKKIADQLGISVSTSNKIRRDAAEKVAESLGYDKDDIVRRRMVNTFRKK